MSDGVHVRIVAIMGTNAFDLGETTVSGMDEARVELPALLRRVADEFEQPDNGETDEPGE